MKIRICLIVLSVLALTLTGCGGGGGGGGESAAGNDSSGLRVLHGALDIPPLTINPGAGSTYNANFRGNSAYRSLPGESASVIVHRANIPSSVLFQLPVVSDGQTKQTLLVYGQENDGSLSAKVHEDNFPELSSGMAAVRVVHALHRTGQIFATVGTDSTRLISHGALSSYITIPAGPQAYSVTESGDPGPFISESSDFEEKKYYTIFVTGEEGVFFTHRVYVDN